MDTSSTGGFDVKPEHIVNQLPPKEAVVKNVIPIGQDGSEGIIETEGGGIYAYWPSNGKLVLMGLATAGLVVAAHATGVITIPALSWAYVSIAEASGNVLKMVSTAMIGFETTNLVSYVGPDPTRPFGITNNQLQTAVSGAVAQGAHTFWVKASGIVPTVVQFIGDKPVATLVATTAGILVYNHDKVADGFGKGVGGLGLAVVGLGAMYLMSSSGSSLAFSALSSSSSSSRKRKRLKK